MVDKERMGVGCLGCDVYGIRSENIEVLDHRKSKEGINRNWLLAGEKREREFQVIPSLQGTWRWSPRSWLLSLDGNSHILVGGDGSVKPVGTLVLGFQAVASVPQWKLPQLMMIVASAEVTQDGSRDVPGWRRWLSELGL